MAPAPPPKSILVLDFDGVCHSYVSGWKGAEVIPDPPVPGFFEALRSYAEVFDVHIVSARSHQGDAIQAMREWMERHSPGSSALVRFSLVKPPALVTIDDRAIRFEGVWPAAADLLNFRPWNASTDVGKGASGEPSPARYDDSGRWAAPGR
jgi:hypothetical protein